MPSRAELPERIESVLAVCYLVFNEGYSSSCGAVHIRADLTTEAIRLGRLLSELLPEAEVFGLLALMLFHDSRRLARTSDDGCLVLLEEQDRSLWNNEMIREAHEWLSKAIVFGEVGPYTIQAAISAVHADARTAAETNWSRIVEWYDLLMQATNSPIVELNRAVAIAMRDGPDAGLLMIEPLVERLASYHLLHAAQADLLRRAGRFSEAVPAYRRALELATQEPERRFLERRLAELTSDENS